MHMDWENRVLTVTRDIKNNADWTRIVEKYAKEFSLAKIIKLPYDMKTIYDRAFIGCSCLERIVIPDGVSSIGSEAFNDCRNLKIVELPESLTTIDSMAFHNCTSLKNINFPNNLQAIDLGAFGCCFSLEKVVLPDSLEYIGRYAFKYCKNLKEINIPSKIKYIKSGTFCNCPELESIKMPKSRLIIEAHAFDAENKLKDIYIAENSVIRPNAFNHSDGLIVHIGDRNVPASYFDYSYVGDFFQNPSYEKMLKIQLMSMKINISMMYIDEDKRYETYLKKNISKTIDYIVKEERIDLIDKLIEYNLISNKAIDNCLDCILKNQFYEAFIMLVKYKEKTDGYNKTFQDRFEL